MNKELFKIIKQNPGGVSIKARGNNYAPAYFKTGYFIALTDNEVRGVRYDIIIAKLHRLAKELNLKTYYFGYWKDEKTNKEYLDLAIRRQRKQEAITLGRLFSQKAIFDCRRLESIYL